MLEEELLEKVVYFTDEEIDNLNGKHKLDKSIFVNENSNIIDYRHLLDVDQFISVRKHTRFSSYPKHKHNYIELIYVYSGLMSHIIEDDQRITLNEGEILLLNQNISHEIEYTGENDLIFNFIIKPEFLEFFSSLLDKTNEISLFIFDALYSYNNKGEYLVFKTKGNNLVNNYVESIIKNIYSNSISAQLELKLLVGLLMAELMNHPENIESFSQDSKEKLLINSIINYIGTEYREGSLEVLSKTLNIPDYKICKIVKKKTRKTFIQLVQNERLNKAKQFLNTTEMPISDIMYEVGYENMTYFYKIFKKKFGMTPSELRKVESAK